jgi:hypothetical protein
MNVDLSREQILGIIKQYTSSLSVADYENFVIKHLLLLSRREGASLFHIKKLSEKFTKKE